MTNLKDRRWRLAMTALSIFALVPLAMPQGVDQKPGVIGRLNTPAVLGSQNPLQFTLRDAWYSVMPFANHNVSDRLKRDEKVLMLEFNVQNATKRDQRLRWAAFELFAVDENGQTHNWQRALKLVPKNSVKGRVTEADFETPLLDMTLRPAQNVRCRASIRVPADLKVTKLIVDRSADAKAKVIRYDLANEIKVRYLPKEFQGESEYVAREVVDAEWSETTGGKSPWYPLGSYIFRVDAFKQVQPEDVGLRSNVKDRLYAATITVKSILLPQHSISTNRFSADSRLMCCQGKHIARARYQADGTRKQGHDRSPLRTGEERQLRIIYYADPEHDMAPEFFEIAEGGTTAESSRVYRFPARRIG